MTPSGKQFPQRGLSATWIPMLCLLLVSSCSSEPRQYEGAFSARQQVKGNADSIAASMDVTWGAALEVLSQQGFIIQQADTASRLILATRELQDEQDEELSYTISATLTLLPSAEQMTRVMIAANQTTEMHQQESRWWHLFWLIPLFPTGTDYTTAVVDRDTVQSPQFYSDFFDAMKASCAAMTDAAQPATGT